MKGALSCVAIAIALLLAGCATTVPPVPAPTPVSYLSLLDGHAIHPIDGAKSIAIHPISSFAASVTESIEVGSAEESARFHQVIDSSGSIEPDGRNFLLVLKTTADRQSIEPKQYEYLLHDQTPSAAGTTTKLVLAPSGKVVSVQITGGAADTPDGQKALRECSPTKLLMILAALGESLHQGQTISRDRSSKDGSFKGQMLVQGHGTFQGRAVVVLTFEGTDILKDHPTEPTRIAGFVFLDEETGISAYWDIDLITQSTVGGKTMKGVANFTMQTDLGGAGQSL